MSTSNLNSAFRRKNSIGQKFVFEILIAILSSRDEWANLAHSSRVIKLRMKVLQASCPFTHLVWEEAQV